MNDMGIFHQLRPHLAVNLRPLIDLPIASR
jgi:hypothetical protein